MISGCSSQTAITSAARRSRRASITTPASATAAGTNQNSATVVPNHVSPSARQRLVENGSITRPPWPTSYLSCSGLYTWRSASSAAAPSTSGDAGRDQRPPRPAAVAQQRPQPQHRQQDQLGEQREQAERVGAGEQQDGDAPGHRPAELPGAQQDQHQPQAQEAGREHRRVAARELPEVHDHRGRRDDHRHHGALDAAQQLAAEAVGQADRGHAQQRRGKAQPEHVVAHRQRGVHQQVVQRRPVPVVDRRIQHAANGVQRGDLQRHRLVALERPEHQTEPEDARAVAKRGDAGQHLGPVGGQEPAHDGGLSRRRHPVRFTLGGDRDCRHIQRDARGRAPREHRHPRAQRGARRSSRSTTASSRRWTAPAWPPR